MYKKPTVFLTGAGASWHYGYPTGEDLIHEIKERCETASDYFRRCSQPVSPRVPLFISRGKTLRSVTEIGAAWRAAADECIELSKRLEYADPLVIDYFLGQNEHLQDIGRLMIAWVILDSEYRWSDTRKNRWAPKERNNWIRFVLSELVSGCVASRDLLENKVYFITFNYDVSLELALCDGLSSIGIFKTEEISQFLSNGRILHIYGQVRDCPPVSNICDFKLPSFNDGTFKGKFFDLLDEIYRASQGIRVIDPHEKENEKQIIAIARGYLAQAEKVYVLGYGFDPNNNDRLQLEKNLGAHTQSPGAKRKAIYFTNYDDNNRVNKRAGKILTGGVGTLLPTQPAVQRIGNWYLEKTTRNVYNALARDFD